jgi:hypothetical protein
VPLWAGRCGDPHGGDPDPGLLELTVADVLEALADLDGDEAASFRGIMPPFARASLQLSGKENGGAG